ncbi:MAG: sulfurtransferase TusA family protein [Pseudomonadota bacterium]
MNASQETLDVRGKNCPLPVVDIYRQIKTMESGDLLCVLTANDDSPRNFRAFCRQSGHELVDLQTRGQDIAIYIRKAKRP